MRLDRGVLCLLGVLAGACGCEGGTGSIDLDHVRSDVLDPIEPDGRVVGVAPTGLVLIARDDGTCVVELDGADGPCVELRLDEPLAWSPDGDMLAASSGRNLAMLLDADISVFDVVKRSVTGLTDDGTDDAFEGPVDAIPSWLDDETVAFVRLVGGFDPDQARQFQIATSTLDGDVTTADIDVEPNLAAGSNPYGDALLLRTMDHQRTELLSVDRQGHVDQVFSSDGRAGLIGPSSRDGRAVAVALADFQRPRPAPIAYLRVGDDPITSDFDAWSAAVAPGGDLVATVVGADPFDGVLTLWVPSTGRTVELAEVRARAAMTWTVDDRLVLWGPEGWQVVELES